jgi:hypothetical protein
MLLVQQEQCCRLMGYESCLERYPPVSIIPVHIDPSERHNKPGDLDGGHRKQAIEMHPGKSRPPEPNRSASSRLSISASKFPVQVVQHVYEAIIHLGMGWASLSSPPPRHTCTERIIQILLVVHSIFADRTRRKWHRNELQNGPRSMATGRP